MNKMRRLAIVVSLLALVATAQQNNQPNLPGADRPLADRFAQPPAQNRILKIIHAQPDDPTAQDRMLRKLADQGFGGFAGNVAFEGYVDDETKWPPFLRGVHAAKAAGMSLWLYDECGYPSGSARDLTLKGHPDWAARGLLVAETNSAGGEVVLAMPPGRLVQAVALPVREGFAQLEAATNLAANVRDGHLRWNAPAGNWTVLVMTDELIYDGTHAAVSLAYKKPCIDLLRPEATARFLEVTHERYAAKLDRNLGKYFVATFTDEPSLMNLWMRPMPWRVLPWSPGLSDAFRKRYREPLLPLLPALVIEAGPRGAKARHDFWQLIGELVSENYFGQIQTWCRQHGFASGGHLLMEESLSAHVPLYGDFFRCARRLDAPSIDCLTSIPADVPWEIARMIHSIADLEGRPTTMCEVSDHVQRYRPAGDGRPVRTVTEDEIRGTCNLLLWGGIDTLTSYYSFAGLEDAQVRRLNEWVGRCSTMLSGGYQVNDVAVLYPIESLWTHFVPAYQGASAATAVRQIQHAYRATGDALFGARRDFDYVDAQAITAARVRDGELQHGQLKWRAVILPAIDTLPLAAWENLARFWQRGGVVVAIGSLPANSERQWPARSVQAIAQELFGEPGGPAIVTNKAGGVGIYLPTGLVALLPALLDQLLEPRARAADPAAPIHIAQRSVGDHDVFFAINDSPDAWSGALHFPTEGVMEQWDPATGTKAAISAQTNVSVQFGPYGGLLFRTPEQTAARSMSRLTAALPTLRTEPLELPAPAVGQGQYVTSAVSGDAVSGWTANARLTKSAVDTHLFFSFDAATTGVLSGAAGLVIETSVPTGQTTRAEVLVILHTRGGADFIAGTGRFLDEAGARRSHILFQQFRLAGWSVGTPGPLAPADVTAIRIGWGGHFGTEGDRVVLTTGTPSRFTLEAARPMAQSGRSSAGSAAAAWRRRRRTNSR